MDKEINSSSVEETKKIAAAVGSKLKGGEVIELNADIGSGKTTFTQGLVFGSGSSDHVSSPSFTITNQYKAPKFTIYHFDFYRLNDPGIIRRELAEALDGKNVIVIEWPEVIENILPDKRLVIKISPSREDVRLIKIDGPKELSYLWSDLK